MPVECKRKIDDPIIFCNHLVKQFVNLHGKEHLVIDDITLNVEKNEFLKLRKEITSIVDITK